MLKLQVYFYYESSISYIVVVSVICVGVDLIFCRQLLSYFENTYGLDEWLFTSLRGKYAGVCNAPFV